MKDICKSFGGIKALDGADFEAKEGEIHGLYGANGSGKSVLAHILAGITAPDNGSVFIGGTALKTGNIAASQSRGIGIFYQESQAMAGITVAQMILLGREPRGRFGIIRERSVSEAAAVFLNKIGLGDIPADSLVGSLPECDIKMVEVARAVLLGERVVVLDEAEAGLDGSGRDKLRVIMRTLKEKGVVVIPISHDAEFLLSLCERVTVLRNGRNFSTVEAEMLQAQELVMLSGEIPAKIQPREVKPRNAAREIPEAGLTLGDGEVTGVKLADGRVKTSVIRAMLGIDPRVNGDVSIFGFSMHMSPPKGAVKHRIGLSANERKLRGPALYVTVREKTAYARLEHASIHTGGESPFAGILGLGGRKDPARETIALASELFRPSGMLDGRIPADLMLKDVDTVIFDDPSRGADESAKSEIYALIGEIAARGKAILVFTTRKEELENLCDRVEEMRVREYW
jgi:ribose transport system ATP-binding protein